MEERNEFLEIDGLYWESDTHEWFNDKVSTNYAHEENINNITLPNIFCFVVREKSTGKYERVIMDSKTNEVIYASDELEQIGSHIDKLKIIKAFVK